MAARSTASLVRQRRVRRPPGLAGLTAAAALALTLTAARGGAQVNHAERRAELLNHDRAAEARARTGRFVDVLSALFAPQGVYVSPGTLGRGPAGARAWLLRDSLNERSSARWTVLRHDVAADGRDGYTYGYFDVIRPSGDTLPGRYHAYWRRTDAGRWEILAFTRVRRGPGSTTSELPPAISQAETRYSRSAARDSVRALLEIARTEAAFADSVAVDVAAGFSGFAAPDAAKVGSDGTYLFGKNGIHSIFAARPAGQLGPAWQPEWGSIASSFDLGFTLGPAWPRHAGAIQYPPADVAGRYFTIWKRQPDGSWRYLVD